MAFKIELAPAAFRALKKLDSDTAQRIADAINELAADPRPAGTKKLSGEDDLYRIRVGDYRIVYEIANKRLEVLVVTIGHRRDVYRSLRRRPRG
ncbi:MAG TPA: type II toxin-antitoxin system RelE/ParE family toxin [Gemmatimonadaceae bacterium]|nr:type II toxin-antitoxin system RelE/ParE family toxin [Gemmatimonadaceae bacterium]